MYLLFLRLLLVGNSSCLLCFNPRALRACSSLLQGLFVSDTNLLCQTHHKCNPDPLEFKNEFQGGGVRMISTAGHELMRSPLLFFLFFFLVFQLFVFLLLAQKYKSLLDYYRWEVTGSWIELHPRVRAGTPSDPDPHKRAARLGRRQAARLVEQSGP